MGVYTVNVEVFPARVLLCTDRKRYAKLRAKYTEKYIDLDGCDGISSDFGYCYLVGVFNGDLDVLVHELAHTTFKILRDVNVPVHVDGNQEAFCYLQGYLFKKLAPWLSKESMCIESEN